MGRIEAIHHLTDPVLRLPWLSAIAIEIDHVLDGLVAMGIVTHVHDLHLTDLVDGEAIVTVVKHRRQTKYGVEHLIKGVLASHEVDQSLWVVEDRPCVVPAITLSEGITPFQRIERLHKLSILQFATHQLRLSVEEMLVVQGALAINGNLLLGFTKSLAQLEDTPVVVGVFQGTGSTLPDIQIVCEPLFFDDWL